MYMYVLMCCLSPIAYCRWPIAYCLSYTACCLYPIAYYLRGRPPRGLGGGGAGTARATATAVGPGAAAERPGVGARPHCQGHCRRRGVLNVIGDKLSKYEKHKHSKS